MSLDAKPYRIRPVSEADAHAIMDLLNPIIAAGRFTAMDRVISLPEQLGFIRSFPKTELFCAAVSTGGALLGIQDVLPDPTAANQGKISTFVGLDHLRRGVGTGLAQWTLQHLAGIPLRILDTIVRRENKGARGYYARLGFQELDAGGSDKLTLRMSLDPILNKD